MKTVLILISFLFFPESTLTHKDTILKIDKSGNIIGLPKKFSPAKFYLDKKYLRINDREIFFPSCLNEYFIQGSSTNIMLLASWYHSKKLLPYYLTLKTYEKNSDEGYSVMINLETLELIEIEKSTVKGNSIFYDEIELGKGCHDEYVNKIKILR